MMPKKRRKISFSIVMLVRKRFPLWWWGKYLREVGLGTHHHPVTSSSSQAIPLAVSIQCVYSDPRLGSSPAAAASPLGRALHLRFTGEVSTRYAAHSCCCAEPSTAQAIYALGIWPKSIRLSTAFDFFILGAPLLIARWGWTCRAQRWTGWPAPAAASSLRSSPTLCKPYHPILFSSCPYVMSSSKFDKYYPFAPPDGSPRWTPGSRRRGQRRRGRPGAAAAPPTPPPSSRCSRWFIAGFRSSSCSGCARCPLPN